jgi:hypothetical protein
VASTLEVGHAARGRRQGAGGGEQPHAWDAHEQLTGAGLTCQLRELALELGHLRFQHPDLIQELLH